jgi:hypothetical protein
MQDAHAYVRSAAGVVVWPAFCTVATSGHVERHCLRESAGSAVNARTAHPAMIASCCFVTVCTHKVDFVKCNAARLRKSPMSRIRVNATQQHPLKAWSLPTAALATLAADAPPPLVRNRRADLTRALSPSFRPRLGAPSTL